MSADSIYRSLAASDVTSASWEVNVERLLLCFTFHIFTTAELWPTAGVIVIYTVVSFYYAVRETVECSSVLLFVCPVDRQQQLRTTD